MGVLEAVGAVVLLLLLVLAIRRAQRHAQRRYREGRWAAQWCVVCLRPISAPDHAVGIRPRAIPNALAGLPEHLREAAESAPTRVLIGHRLCADAESVAPGDRVDVRANLAQATAGELTCPSCARVFTPPGMAILRPDDPSTDRDSFSVVCPGCRATWQAVWRIG